MVVRRPAAGESTVERVDELSAGLRQAERPCADSGVAQCPFESVVGCPIIFQVGGVGGSRFLGMPPRPGTRLAWSDLSFVPPGQELCLVRCARSAEILPSSRGRSQRSRRSRRTCRSRRIRLCPRQRCRLKIPAVPAVTSRRIRVVPAVPAGIKDVGGFGAGVAAGFVIAALS